MLQETLIFFNVPSGPVDHDSNDKVEFIYNHRAHYLIGSDSIKPHGHAIVVSGIKGEAFYKMLRREAVQASSVPLSSDAFTTFGLHNARIHNREV